MKNKLDKNLIYFMILFLLILVFYLNEIYNIKINIKLKSTILLILTLIYIIDMKINKKDNLKISILFLLIIFLRKYYISFYIVFISRFLTKKRRLQIILIIMLFFYILTLVLNYFGYLEFNNIKYGLTRYGDILKIRNPLGFSHPNTTMVLMLPIFFLLYYLYYSRLKIMLIVIFEIINIYLFYYTNSRISFLLINLFLSIIFLGDKFISKIKVLFYLQEIIIVIFSIILPIFFHNSILDGLFSGRLIYSYCYLKNISITFLGKNMTEIYNTYYPLDNIYLKIIYENGILGLILCIIIIFYIINLLYKNKDYKAIRIFSIILILGFMESIAFYYFINIICFIIPEYIFGNKEITIKNIK